MAKKKSPKVQSPAIAQPAEQSDLAIRASWKRYVAPAAIVLMLSAAAVIFFSDDKIFRAAGNKSSGSADNANVQLGTNTAEMGITGEPIKMNVAQAVMVTVDLDYSTPVVTTALLIVLGVSIAAWALLLRPVLGRRLFASARHNKIASAVCALIAVGVAIPLLFRINSILASSPATIPDAIGQIERGYAPDDGVGRTFAILDAYGEPMPDGKLHMSMHVSSEKTGMATLKFKRTGEMLWRARIGNPGDPSAGQKNLTIFLDKGLGNRENYVLDGSRGGSSVLEVFLQNSEQRVRDVWPDGAEREVTFVYSACGCPVKVMCRRVGDRTMRTSVLPVIFPDDPAVVRTISNLMKW
jgi:hypothetical protein